MGALRVHEDLKMNRRTLLGCLLAGLTSAGCGGRMSPVTFGQDSIELAKQLSTSLGKKDMNAVRRCADAATRRADAGKMPSDEIQAFKWAVGEAEKGEWDKAKDYIDKSIASGK
jgi:hypothetical protein